MFQFRQPITDRIRARYSIPRFTSLRSRTHQPVAYQIKLVEPKVIFAHRDSLSSILQALEDPEIRVSPRNIIVIGNEKETNTTVSIDAVIQIGSTLPKLEERSLAVGEARSKVAFLAFSSGTTGPPKVRTCPYL